MAELIGFVGLGAMGFPMTRALADAGNSLRVFDLSSETLARAASHESVGAASDLAEIAAHCGIVFTCLPNDAVIRETYLGTAGLAPHILPGALTIDCSTVSPGVTNEIYSALRKRGVFHLDAAMLGSVPQAETGEIGFVVGGEREAFDRAAPLLDILGRFRRHAGPSGSGNRVKLIHQLLVAVNAVTVAEAIALCRASDTDLDCFYDVVCGGGGFAYSKYFEKRVPRMRAGEFQPLFALSLMRKDAGLARELAETCGMPAPMLAGALLALDQAEEAGWGTEDFSAVAHLYERAIGRALSDALSD
jgi:3-hydroxyisobutyrate dehydrogenase-like beta-hydroxyacid dehydrogenase